MFEKLFKFEEVHEACAESFSFSGVTMLVDAGPYKAGEKIDTIWYDTEKAELSFFSSEESATSGKPDLVLKAHVTIDG